MLLPMGPTNLFSVDARYFTIMMIVQTQVAFLLNCWVGPVLIAGDLTNGPFHFFLSRPFSRSEYVLGKLSVLALLLSGVTWIPCLFLFGLQAGLARNGWLWSHVWMSFRSWVCSAIWILNAVSPLARCVGLVKTTNCRYRSNLHRLFCPAGPR